MSQSENPSSNQPAKSTMPQICAGGCGFYGNPDQENFCSVCYKQKYPQKNAKSEPNKEEPKNDNKIENENGIKNDDDKNNKIEEKINDDNNDSNKIEKKKKKKKKNRCQAIDCKKKLTLAGKFTCKCGGEFCGLHRYADAHQCSYDHKTQHQKKLAKENKVVNFSKLDKI